MLEYRPQLEITAWASGDAEVCNKNSWEAWFHSIFLQQFDTTSAIGLYQRYLDERITDVDWTSVEYHH